MSNSLSPNERARTAVLFEKLSAKLMRILRKQFPRTDLQLISDAVVSAILTVVMKGIQEDRKKGSLCSLLKRIAERRVQDSLRRQELRQKHEKIKTQADVTRADAAAKQPWSELLARETTEEIGQKAAELSEHLIHDDEEKKFLWLKTEGKSDEQIICGMGWNSLDPEAARARLATLSARIRKRMSRLKNRLSQEDAP